MNPCGRLLRNLRVGNNAFGQPAHADGAVFTAFDAAQTFQIRLGQNNAFRHNDLTLVVVDRAGEDIKAGEVAGLHLSQQFFHLGNDDFRARRGRVPAPP